MYNQVESGNIFGTKQFPASFSSLTRLTSGPPELPYCKKTNKQTNIEHKSKEAVRIMSNQETVELKLNNLRLHQTTQTHTWLS